MRKLITVKPAFSQSWTHSKALWASLHCNRDISLLSYMCRCVGGYKTCFILWVLGYELRLSLYSKLSYMLSSHSSSFSCSYSCVLIIYNVFIYGILILVYNKFESYHSHDLPLPFLTTLFLFLYDFVCDPPDLLKSYRSMGDRLSARWTWASYQ